MNFCIDCKHWIRRFEKAYAPGEQPIDVELHLCMNYKTLHDLVTGQPWNGRRCEEMRKPGQPCGVYGELWEEGE